eukprot:1195369-Prorocentrum_minimum.AAC.2
MAPRTQLRPALSLSTVLLFNICLHCSLRRGHSLGHPPAQFTRADSVRLYTRTDSLLQLTGVPTSSAASVSPTTEEPTQTASPTYSLPSGAHPSRETANQPAYLARAGACPDGGYFEQIGDILGWGEVGGRGGGEVVSSRNQCASICSSILARMSFECSNSALKCSLNSQRDVDPTRDAYRECMFCSKGRYLTRRDLSHSVQLQLTTNNTAASSAARSPPAVYYDHHEYYLYLPNPGVNYADAEAYCSRDGRGHLASFRNQANYWAVIDNLRKWHSSIGFFWVGMTDSAQEGTWTATDNGPNRWTYFEDTQPDNYNNAEHCTAVRSTGNPTNWQWFDVHCGATSQWDDSSAHYGAICKRPAGVSIERRGSSGGPDRAAVRSNFRVTSALLPRYF